MDNAMLQSQGLLPTEGLCTSEGLCQAMGHPSSWASVASRLINERLSWQQESAGSENNDQADSDTAAESKDAAKSANADKSITTREAQAEPEATAAERAVTGLQQLINYNSGSDYKAPVLNNVNIIQIHQRAALETIWKKQVHKTNLFGGKGIRSAELSPSQVRLGQA